MTWSDVPMKPILPALWYDTPTKYYQQKYPTTTVENDLALLVLNLELPSCLFIGLRGKLLGWRRTRGCSWRLFSTVYVRDEPWGCIIRNLSYRLSPPMLKQLIRNSIDIPNYYYSHIYSFFIPQTQQSFFRLIQQWIPTLHWQTSELKTTLPSKKKIIDK